MTDGKTWYLCDPKKNRDCRKMSCRWYGRGSCALTSKPACARTDPRGKPIEVNPREMLREKMKERTGK